MGDTRERLKSIYTSNFNNHNQDEFLSSISKGNKHRSDLCNIYIINV